MSKLIRRSATNPTLRKLYRMSKKINENAEEGHLLMCPCGCTQMFKKKENQIYAKQSEGGVNHKDTYHNRVRSKSNYAFDQKMLEIERRMVLYVNKNKDLLPKNKPKAKKEPEAFDKRLIDSTPTKENFIKLMQQNKSINKNKKVGSEMLCPCGCGETIIKKTYQQAYAQSKLMSHKDNYYNIIRGDVDLNLEDPQTIKSFEIMHKNVKKELNDLKNQKEEKKVTSRMKRR